jgi:hypothetical protein
VNLSKKLGVENLIGVITNLEAKEGSIKSHDESVQHLDVVLDVKEGFEED